MESYQSPRIAGTTDFDGLSLPGEVQLALDDLAGSVREGPARALGRRRPEDAGRAARGGPPRARRPQGPPTLSAWLTGTARAQARSCSRTGRSASELEAGIAAVMRLFRLP